MSEDPFEPLPVIGRELVFAGSGPHQSPRLRITAKAMGYDPGDVLRRAFVSAYVSGFCDPSGDDAMGWDV